MIKRFFMQPHWVRNFLLCILTTNVLSLPGGVPQTEKELEYSIKAGFMCKFVKFIQWPSEAFPSPDVPITIGILGEDHFGTVMDEAVRDLKIKNRRFVIRRYPELNSIESCHILFISRSEKERLGKIVSLISQTPTLTVSEVDGFCQQGGMVNFVIIDNKVRFEINMTAAARSNLQVSTRLLGVAIRKKFHHTGKRNSYSE